VDDVTHPSRVAGYQGPTAASPGRTLLAAGILAGPVYVLTSLVEVILRPGFDLTRHSLSLLSNGDGGLIHSTMMLVAGGLMVVGAVGLGRALRDGRGRTWGPILVGVFGASFIAAGLMTPDPALGFPPGTPDGPPVVVTWHSIGHLVAGSAGFLGLIGACFVFARRFRANGEGGLGDLLDSNRPRRPRRRCRNLVREPGSDREPRVHDVGRDRLDLDNGRLRPYPGAASGSRSGLMGLVAAERVSLGSGIWAPSSPDHDHSIVSSMVVRASRSAGRARGGGQRRATRPSSVAARRFWRYG